MWQSNANLDGLVDLSRRQGVDVRPSLLRVLTDLYVQQKSHTAEETLQYAELAMRLLPVVDVPTRAAVAAKLAPYEYTPAAVLELLRRDVAEVARLVDGVEPATPPSAKPTTQELITALFGGPPAPVAAAATTTEAAPALPATPKDAQQPVTAHSPAIAPPPAVAGEAPPDAGDADAEPDTADAHDARAATPSLGERFLAASSEARCAMLLDMENEHVPASLPPRPANIDAVIARLEAAAMGQKSHAFAQELQHALGLPAFVAMQIAEDARGESLLVAARALAMPAAVLQRIVIFLNPAIGHSVRHVFALANFYERVSRNAAARLVESWRRDMGQTRRARYVGVHAPEAPERTTAVLEHARRPLARGADTAQRGDAAAPGERRQRTT